MNSIQSKETELQKALFQACRVEEEYWRQKSKSMWLESGDKNTTYFHKQAEARKNYKAVTKIYYQGTLVKILKISKKWPSPPLKTSSLPWIMSP